MMTDLSAIDDIDGVAAFAGGDAAAGAVDVVANYCLY